MVLDKDVISWIETQCGRKIRCSADCEYLALDIESLTGEHIGVNTIKRLLGFIQNEHNPRTTTLDIIARYLGCETWENMRKYTRVLQTSSFTNIRVAFPVREMEPGSRIRILYFPERIVDIEYQGDYHFIVFNSVNSKLQQGDQLFLTHIIPGSPLWVSDVIRDGKSLGSFSTGESLINIRLFRQKKKNG